MIDYLPEDVNTVDYDVDQEVNRPTRERVGEISTAVSGAIAMSFFR